MHKYFKLYANCIAVKGARESFIFDLENESYFQIPNLLFDILEENRINDICINILKSRFQNKFDEGIDSFFNELAKNKIGFFTSTSDLYPELNRQWFSPFLITNSIIEFSKASPFNLKDILCQLNELGCLAIELRVKDENHEIISNVLSFFKQSRFRCYVIFIEYSTNKFSEEFIKIARSFKRIVYVHFFSAPDAFVRKYQGKENIFANNISLEEYEKDISSSDFKINVNIEIFMEAQNFNIGLNRKVCIDEKGCIKNYINHKKVFGKVMYDDIRYIVEKKEFQEKWLINNDNIAKCKDCQYRYVCVSSSDIQRENGMFYKVNLCKFDPYINTWES